MGEGERLGSRLQPVGRPQRRQDPLERPLGGEEVGLRRIGVAPAGRPHAADQYRGLRYTVETQFKDIGTFKTSNFTSQNGTGTSRLALASQYVSAYFGEHGRVPFAAAGGV